MSWKITPSQPVPVDPLFNNVSLLLHGDGTNGSTTITDSSLSPKTVTAVGNAQISTAQSKFGGSSIAFDGGGDYLDVTASNDLVLGSTWTVEAWWYLNAVGAGSDRNSLLLAGTVNQAGALAIYQEGPTPFLSVRAGVGGSDVSSSGNSIVAQQWQHIAISCLNNIAAIYINGTEKGTGPVNGPVTAAVSRIASIGIEDYNTNGYIDDLRITKGVARYTSNFTPPTAPFPDI